jgi:hypothetical protein
MSMPARILEQHLSPRARQRREAANDVAPLDFELPTLDSFDGPASHPGVKVTTLLTPDQRMRTTTSMPALRIIKSMTAAPDLRASAIEMFAPHLVEKITALWGTAALHQCLSDLSMMDRPDRQGFPREVASELFTLFSLNKELANITDPQERFR